MVKLILASSSPRRIEMLKNLKLNFKIQKPNVIEKVKRSEAPKKYVQRLSFEKALNIASFNNNKCFILAADTIVVLNGKILEKPKSRNHAFQMLTKLSGKTHDVITGWCWLSVKSKNKLTAKTYYDVTKVTFSKKSKTFWRWYSRLSEPMDKAGSYAAQGIGLSFIESFHGSYSNVVGLPLPKVIASFEKLTGLNFYAHFRRN